jgi:hypothetical protein
MRPLIWPGAPDLSDRAAYTHPFFRGPTGHRDRYRCQDDVLY